MNSGYDGEDPALFFAIDDAQRHIVVFIFFIKDYFGVKPISGGLVDEPIDFLCIHCKILEY